MNTNENSALGRVLAISREAYSAVAEGMPDVNRVALLDAVSAALSHYNNSEKPLAKCMRAFRAELRRAGKPFWQKVKPPRDNIRQRPDMRKACQRRGKESAFHG